MVDFIFSFHVVTRTLPEQVAHILHTNAHTFLLCPALSAHVGDPQGETEKFKLCSIFRGFSGGRARDRTLGLSRVKGNALPCLAFARPKNRRRSAALRSLRFCREKRNA